MHQDTPARARVDALIVEHLGDETLVYDTTTDTAHCLGPVAATIWGACDGTRDRADLAALVEDREEGDAMALVDQALADLADRALLEDIVTRRAVLTRLAGVGAAALAVPLVFSIDAPTAEAAVSKTADGGVCTGNGNCVNNSCVQGKTLLGGTGTGPSHCNTNANCLSTGQVSLNASACCSLALQTLAGIGLACA